MERKVSSDVSGTFHNPLNTVGDPSIHDDVGCVVHDHVVVDDEKLSQGFHGHVGKISDSSQCTEPEQPPPAALQHKLDEIPNESVNKSHASCHQKGIGGRAPDDLWRNSSKTVEHHGDRESPFGTQGSQRDGHSEREGTATDAPCHDRTEQGQQEEVRPCGLREQQAHGEDPRHRDHSGAAALGHQEDLPDHSRLSGGSCGVRGTLQSAVPRASSPTPTVCQLGREDRHRGGMRLPPGPSGQLAPEPRGTASDADLQADLQRLQEHIDAGQRLEWQDREHDDADDADDARPQGGRGQSESREASQEGRSIQCLRDDRVIHRLFRADPTVASAGSVENFNLSQAGMQVDSELWRGSWEALPEQKVRHLSHCSDRLISNAFEALLSHQRIELLEVACSADSVLSRTMQQKKGDEGAARRCSLFNEYDLGTNQGIHKVIQDIDHYKPKHVWLSPVCGPFSVMQNINQRSEAQKEALSEKRKAAMKQYVGCSVIYTYCIQHGIHVTWEWSQSCQAWRLPMTQELVKKHNPWFAVVRGCRVGLVDDEKNPISKGWKLMTTHALLAKRMNMPCSCGPHQKHVKCEGSLTNKTAYYTPEFARRVCDALIHGAEDEDLKREFVGDHQIGETFGNGISCSCHHIHDSQHGFVCGSCVHDEHERIKGTNHGKCDSKGNHEVLVGEDNQQRGQGLTIEEIRKRLYLLHAATGHGPTRHLVQALRRRGVSEDVLREAERFECSVCKERGRPKPRPLATLEPHPPKWASVSGDIGHWEHPQTKESYQFLMFVDEGCRFRVGKIVLTGKRSHLTANQFVETFGEHWVQYFGFPNQLRVDPDGSFRSHVVQEYCDRHQIMLDIIPGEAHWKVGICEQAIQGTKTLMNKIAEDDPEVTAAEALAEATRTFNSRELIRGYSPIQHALGRAPDATGRLFPCGPSECPELLVENASGEMDRQLQRMQSAEKAFLEWTASQRLQKAKNSKPRDVTNYEPGDLVYVWRKQVSGQAAIKGGSFVGPARILAVEQHRSPDGTHKQGSSIWCVRGRRLLKCSPEQLRRASEREVLLEELHAKQYDDWDFDRVAQQLGGNEFLDVSTEVPSYAEWLRAQDPVQEWQPMRRCARKRGPMVDEMSGMGPAPSTSRPTGRSRSPTSRPTPSTSSGAPVSQRPRMSAQQGMAAAPPWWNQSSVQEVFAATECTFWMDETAAVAVEVPMPDTRAGSERALRDLPSYFASSLKKRSAVEVCERHLSEEERQQFRSAKAVEVSNFIAAKAFEALPEKLRPAREQAVKMRWILTWKQKEDGSRKAKARAVLLGYQDPCYEQRATTSPTTTRQTRQLQMQLAASYRHKMRKGDVTGAFLQSRPYPDDLFCIPCPEICEKMGLPAESITKVKKACYGLVDAPLEWYRSISDFFAKLGLQKCWSDACCWVYVVDGVTKGIISGHVDDFLFSGDETHEGWCTVLKSIQTEYKWGDWEEKRFTQCGVQVEQHEDFSFSLSQSKYVEDLKYINLRAFRKKDRNAPTEESEKTQLRALLGGVSWHAQQVAPHFSAEVGLLLSEVNKSTIETIYKANRLLDKVKDMKEHCMKVHAIEPHMLSLFAWVDAASQNRVDGSSTQGIIVGISSHRLRHGSCEPVTFVAWHSQKIGRICRSPGAAEAAAANNGEDLLFFARFQLAEMMGAQVNVRDINSVVNQISGCLVTDSRNVYDKLETEVLSVKGAEKRTDLELLSLKSAQIRNAVEIRWVHSEAQLSNGLTKSNEHKQLHLFYRMGHKWRIVEDEERASARKRKLLGLEPLENRKSQGPEIKPETPWKLTE